MTSKRDWAHAVLAGHAGHADLLINNVPIADLPRHLVKAAPMRYYKRLSTAYAAKVIPNEGNTEWALIWYQDAEDGQRNDPWLLCAEDLHEHRLHDIANWLTELNAGAE